MNIFQIDTRYIQTLKSSYQIKELFSKWSKEYSQWKDRDSHMRLDWFFNYLIRENEGIEWKPDITANITSDLLSY